MPKPVKLAVAPKMQIEISTKTTIRVSPAFIRDAIIDLLKVEYGDVPPGAEITWNLISGAYDEPGTFDGAAVSWQVDGVQHDPNA